MLNITKNFLSINSNNNNNMKHFFKKMFGKKKPKEPFCKNCSLFDPINKLCGVVIINEGQKIHLPVEAEDACFFENEFVAKNETFKPNVKQIKVWVEDPKTGEKSKNGIVKIESPNDDELPDWYQST